MTAGFQQEEAEGSAQASSSSSKPQCLEGLALGIEEVTDAIRNALSSKDEAKKILQLKDADAESFINLLDTVST